jgi:predicted O-linked N-acetylglucosamine transferase (SPINDLY family)
VADGLHTEKLVRLPGCFLCYRPYEYDVPVESLPFGKTGHITYGSFCNLTKITSRVAALWSQILRKNNNSRLVLKSRQLNDPGVRSFYTGLFSENGIAPERIDLYGHCASYREHLEAYNRVDIALDPFPYNGTTTTCEAMWMGVPVITLCGDRHSARVGKSLLTAVGHQELIAQDQQDYVRKAVQIADNIDWLKNVRFNLRNDMQGSSLCDESTYVRHIEEAFAVMWQRYRESRSENQVA